MKKVEFIVGLFILAAILGLIFLAFKVTDLDSISMGGHYEVFANFTNIGGLKVGAPVSIGGVKVGDVASISMDPKVFQAHVTLSIQDRVNNLPTDTSAGIYTMGLLGSSYIGLVPGFQSTVLKNHSSITTTHSALVLEKLIGQMMYSFKSKKG